MQETPTSERPVLDPGTGTLKFDSVGARIDRVLQNAMSRSPADRYRSADLMRRAMVAARVELD
jgi:hypothetical protein